MLGVANTVENTRMFHCMESLLFSPSHKVGYSESEKIRVKTDLRVISPDYSVV